MTRLSRTARTARTARKARTLLAGLALTAAAPAAAQSIETSTLTVGAQMVSTGQHSNFRLAQPIGRAGALPTFPRFEMFDGVRLQTPQGDPATAETVDLVTIAGDPRELGLPAYVGAASLTNGTIRRSMPDLGDEQPVVFTALAFGGTDPAQVTVVQAWRQGVSFQLAEAPGYDGVHTSELMRYLAIARGAYRLPDGRLLIAGRATLEPGATEVRVELPVALFDDAATITSLEGYSTQSTVRVDELGADGLIDALSLRLDRADGTPSTAGASIGYMVIGEGASTPSLTLLSADSGASIEYLTEPNGGCRALADYGLAGALEAAELTGLGQARVQLALYDREGCAGEPTVIEASGLDTTYWLHADAGPSGARSFRVLHRGVDSSAEVGCIGRGEMWVDNGFAAFGVDEAGTLGLFHRDPRDGALVADTVLAEGIDELCRDANDGPGSHLRARRGWAQPWSTQSLLPSTGLAWGDVSSVQSVTLGDDCVLTVRDTAGRSGTVGDADGCLARLPFELPSLQMSFEIIFGDIDGDGDPEMVLMVENGDGTGYLMTDPLGIADMLTTLGYPVDDDFYDALSVTQQATLQQQTEVVYYGGARTGDEVREFIELLHSQNPRDPALMSTFGVTPFKAKLDVEIGGDAQALGPIDGRVRVGRFQFELDVADNGAGMSLAITASEIEFTYQGYATATFRGGAVYGTVASYSNAFAVGAGADAASVTLTGGRTDRSHLAVTAAAGTSFWAEARMGRNDQYGFSLALPICPISIAVYVKGEDAVWVANETARLASDGWGYAQIGYHETAEFATDAWNLSRDWTVNAAGDTRVFFEDTARDTRVFAEKSYGSAVVAIESGAQRTEQFFTGVGDDIAAGFDQTTQAISDGFMSAAYDAGALAESVGDDIAAWGEGAWNDGSNWAEGAANDVGNWVQGAANDVANFFGGLF